MLVWSADILLSTFRSRSDSPRLGKTRDTEAVQSLFYAAMVCLTCGTKINSNLFGISLLAHLSVFYWISFTITSKIECSLVES